MTNTVNTGTRTDVSAGYPQGQPNHAPARRSTETKLSLKTTELMAYIGAVLAVVVTAFVVDGNAQGSADPFGAAEAMRYITWLTIGYMVARGLAKSGSHENYNAS
jgi:hypothetical protein